MFTCHVLSEDDKCRMGCKFCVSELFQKWYKTNTLSLSEGFDVHVTMQHDIFPIIKPTRCTNFTNLFWNETLHVSDSSSVHHQEFFTVHTAVVCHTGLLTACEQDQDGTILIAMVYVIQVC